MRRIVRYLTAAVGCVLAFNAVTETYWVLTSEYAWTDSPSSLALGCATMSWPLVCAMLFVVFGQDDGTASGNPPKLRIGGEVELIVNLFGLHISGLIGLFMLYKVPATAAFSSLAGESPQLRRVVSSAILGLIFLSISYGSYRYIKRGLGDVQ